MGFKHLHVDLGLCIVFSGLLQILVHCLVISGHFEEGADIVFVVCCRARRVR